LGEVLPKKKGSGIWVLGYGILLCGKMSGSRSLTSMKSEMATIFVEDVVFNWGEWELRNGCEETG